jgi:hypothetical protein
MNECVHNMNQFLPSISSLHNLLIPRLPQSESHVSYRELDRPKVKCELQSEEAEVGGFHATFARHFAETAATS